MKNKKMLFTLLSLTLAAASLTGCGGGSDEKESASSAAAEKVESVDEDGREMIGNMYKEGLPVVKETESFTIFVDDNSEDASSKYMLKEIEKQTNIEVEIMGFPFEVANEKKNLLLNSGDYPEVFGGWILTENDILKGGLDEGIYLPLNEYFDAYAPNIQKALSYEGVRETMTLPDGNIYTIPYVSENPLAAYVPWINQTWLDNLGLEMPTTTDEFAEVLRAFKTQDPNGNGVADEIPFSADPDNKNLGMLAGWFGVNATGTTAYYSMEDGKAVFQADKEEYKEYIKYMNGLYSEGLIDLEIFTHDLQTWKAKGQQNLYGASIAWGPGDFTQIMPNEYGDYVALPVLTAPGVETPVYNRGSYGSTTYKRQAAITDAAENPEIIVRWFDTVFSEENSTQINWGPIGKKIEKVEDGVYRQLDSAKLTEEEQEMYDWGQLYPQALPKFIPLGTELLPPEGIAEPVDHKADADAIYEPFLTEMVPSVWATNDVKDKLSILQTDITNYVEQKEAEWITGQADIDEQWDEYLEQLDKYGLEELTQIKNDLIASQQ